MFYDSDKYDPFYTFNHAINNMIDEAFPEHEVKSFISRAVGAVSDCENDRTPDAETENDAVSAEEETTVSLKKARLTVFLRC